MQDGNGRAQGKSIEDLRHDVAGGLLYTHHRANANTSRILEVAAFSYAAIELLKERGLLTEEELNERKQIVGERLLEKYMKKNMGIMLQDGDKDKYQFQGSAPIDCENRLHLCKAACCKLQFALSRQDVKEGIVQWDLEHPYMNAQAKNGYCTHLKQGACRCSIYAHRPIPCRAYDCRGDTRIWQDFERRIVSPDLEKLLTQSPSGSSHADGDPRRDRETHHELAGQNGATAPAKAPIGSGTRPAGAEAISE